jgi:hypothetical protein
MGGGGMRLSLFDSKKIMGRNSLMML